MAFAVVTVAVTAGSIAVFGEAITDPVEIVARIDNVWVTVIGAITFVIATIGINVVANFVSAVLRPRQRRTASTSTSAAAA